MESNINASIGVRLKKLRSERQLTLEALSALTGVSVSMLSAIERGRKSPTLTILNKINSGLQISLSELFDEASDDDRRIIRKEDMRTFRVRKGSELWMMADCARCNRFDVKWHEICPHSRRDSEPHFGGELWEYCIVIRGELTMIIEGNTYTVRAGDVFSFHADVVHTYVNQADEDLCMIIISAYR